MLDLLAAVQSVDPLSVPLLVLVAFAAGMYPVGFLFGSCSACCCVCGTPPSDLSDWCCSGTHPEEITVRINNGTTISNPGYCDAECIAGQVVVDCASIDGDYVLQKIGCQYEYTPEPECDDGEEYVCGDPPGVAAFVGIAVIVKVCDYDSQNRNPVVGPGYNICVIFGSTRIGYSTWGLAATWDGQSTIYTLPAGEYRQAFESPNCDLRGDITGSIYVNGLGGAYMPAGISVAKTMDSCDTCGSVVVGKCRDDWVFDGRVICDGQGGIECEWDVSILPPPP